MEGEKIRQEGGTERKKRQDRKLEPTQREKRAGADRYKR